MWHSRSLPGSIGTTIGGPSTRNASRATIHATVTSEPPTVLQDGTDRITLEIEPTLDQVALLVERLEEFATERSVPPGDAYKIGLAVDELVTNIVMYGITDGVPADIRVAIRLRRQQMRIVVQNRGTRFNPFREAPLPDTTSSLDDRPIGGLGIFLVRSLMSSVRYERIGDRNQVTLTRSLEPAEQENNP